MAKTLTDSAIKALAPGATVYDSVARGLHVRASATRKSFFLFYRAPDGRSRRPKLGDVGVLTIAAAREIARGHLAAVAGGADPMADRNKRRMEPTVKDFFTRCWREHFSHLKDARNVERIFNARVAPRLGNTRVRSISYDDVAGLHRALSATPFEANRTLALVSKMLNLAERYGERDIGSNPCRHVSRYRELKRSRFAHAPELAAIGAALDDEWARNPASACFIGLLIFTGMRPGEVAAGRREWIERLPRGGILRLPDSKTGQRDVYLSARALALIDALPAPRDGTLTGIKYPRRTWDSIRAAAAAPDLRLYDLRRTFATVSLAGGQAIGLIGEVLGHKTSQTTKIYARLMHEPAAALVAATGEKMGVLLGGTM